MRLQFALVRRQPDDLLSLCTIPFTAVILISVVLDAARPDLVTNALLAPALIGLWSFAVNVAGDMIQIERAHGRLETSLAVPARLHPVLFGRICAVMALGLLPLVETWLLGVLVFGVEPTVHHPWIFAVAMLVSLFAMAGTSMVFVASFLLSRNAGVYQNFLSFPIYILSGVMVPITFLPAWLHPWSKLIFLSWSADLLRDCLLPQALSDAPVRLLAIAGLGAAALAGGSWLLRAVVRRAQELGSVTYA
jgi:ABC-2 type transport system permease protein